jgi:uncharacterized protein (DUF2235 family)
VRHLVVCCDGTWQTPRNKTNVHRLARAVAPSDGRGAVQECRYFEGVGAVGSLTARATGGVAGAGLSRNVRDAYEWLATTYRAGDKISLFGFSRGAFTVRSLAGMVGACGLLDLSGTGDKEARALVERVYEKKYRARERALPNWREGLRFRFDPVDAVDMPVWFIGVWDTVGSLGIPDHLGLVNLVDSPRRYEFHDVTLNPRIAHGRHAIALDEFRAPFTPTLWSEPATGQTIEQVWFPGDHSDVGGGRRTTGLSDGALQWMMQEATAAVGLVFDREKVAAVRPDPSDDIHGELRTAPGPAARVAETLFQPRPRAVPLIDPDDPTDPSVHGSAYARQRNRQLRDGPYRPTRTLAPGESASVDVAAGEWWNATGLYLTTGDHRFSATGEWRSAAFRSGPAGEKGTALLHPRALGHLVGTLIGQTEDLFRRATGNAAAAFLGARRESLPWMSLVGVVANEIPDVPGKRTRPHERIAIGAGTLHHVARPGYLYAFANDAWGFYRNNSGTVRLTVTRGQGGSSRVRPEPTS